MHAASRAISGGPVYISDRPGEHNVDILRRIVLDDGSILRPVSNALPTLDGLFSDPQRTPGSLLSVWNENPTRGHGVIGVFNIYGSAWNQGRRIYTPVPGAASAAKEAAAASAAAAAAAGTGEEAAAAEGGERDHYAIYLHNSRRLSVGKLDDAMEVELPAGSFEVAAVSRVREIAPASGGGSAIAWASVGLADMFNAGGAIMSEDVRSVTSGHHDGGGGAVSVSSVVRGSGLFLAVCSRAPSWVELDGRPVPFWHHFGAGTADDGIGRLEVDLPAP
ncbi:unnamed protein product, partial [Phaeothamnion confervicola]